MKNARGCNRFCDTFMTIFVADSGNGIRQRIIN